MESTKPNHVPALDGVRGIAVLMVMIFHYCQANNFFPDQPILKVLSKLSVLGQTGVDLFFVLSGFLITRILLHEKNTPGAFLKTFFARRVLRIFPLYYGFLIFIYFLLPILTSSEIVPFSKQIWFWGYLQNFVYTFPIAPFEGPNHLWSLAVEEHFYLVWPFLVYFLGTTTLVRVAGGCLLGGVVVRSFFLSHGIGVFFFTLCRLDGLVMGALLALLEQGRGLQAYRKSFLIGALLLMGLLAGVWPYTTGRGLDWLQILKPLLMAIFYFCCVGYIIGLSSQSQVYTWLTQRWLTQIGLISYGLYIFHPLCFDWVLHSSLGQNGIISFVLAFTFVLGVALASYRFYESPFLKLKKYFV